MEIILIAQLLILLRRNSLIFSNVIESDFEPSTKYGRTNREVVANARPGMSQVRYPWMFKGDRTRWKVSESWSETPGLLLSRGKV